MQNNVSENLLKQKMEEIDKKFDIKTVCLGTLFEETPNYLDKKQKLKNLEQTLTLLQSQKNCAMKKFNVSVAWLVENQINFVSKQVEALKDELLQMKKDIAKSNINQNNCVLKPDLINCNFDVLENYANELAMQQAYKIKYPIIKEYLNQLPKEDVLKTILETDFYLQHIGEKNFSEILESVQ